MLPFLSADTTEGRKYYNRIDIYNEDVEKFLARRIKTGKYKYDVIVCQQAVNYWLNCQTAQMIKLLLREHGCFVFNTFNTQPPTEPTFKSYTIDGVKYGEAFYCDISQRSKLLFPSIGVVHHLQMREGMAPHLTSFDWISPEGFRSILADHFIIEEHIEDATTMYVCKSNL